MVEEFYSKNGSEIARATVHYDDRGPDVSPRYFVIAVHQTTPFLDLEDFDPLAIRRLPGWSYSNAKAFSTQASNRESSMAEELTRNRQRLEDTVKAGRMAEEAALNERIAAIVAAQKG